MTQKPERFFYRLTDCTWTWTGNLESYPGYNAMLKAYSEQKDQEALKIQAERQSLIPPAQDEPHPS